MIPTPFVSAVAIPRNVFRVSANTARCKAVLSGWAIFIELIIDVRLAWRFRVDKYLFAAALYVILVAIGVSLQVS